MIGSGDWKAEMKANPDSDVDIASYYGEAALTKLRDNRDWWVTVGRIVEYAGGVHIGIHAVLCAILDTSDVYDSYGEFDDGSDWITIRIPLKFASKAGTVIWVVKEIIMDPTLTVNVELYEPEPEVF